MGTDLCEKHAEIGLSKSYWYPTSYSLLMFGIIGLLKQLIKTYLSDGIIKNIRLDIGNSNKYKLLKQTQESFKNIETNYLGYTALYIEGIKSVSWIYKQLLPILYVH